MKPAKTFLTFILINLIIGACSYNYSESGNTVYGIEPELKLAKKALRFISENKPDSLKGLLDRKARSKVKPHQMEWIMKEGQKILYNYKYPHDSIISFSQSVNVSLTGKTVYKEISFPFQMDAHEDSTKYFKITIVNNEIYKLMISSGIRIIQPSNN